MSRSSSSRDRPSPRPASGGVPCERPRERGQAEPTVALAAVLALSLGLSAYAVVLDGVRTDGAGAVGAPDASATLERIADAVAVGGVAAPARLAEATGDARTDAAGVNVTLDAAGRRWSVGGRLPGPESTTIRASRRLAVELAPGRVRPGSLTVRAWR